MKIKTGLFLFLLSFTCIAYSQSQKPAPKTLVAKRTTAEFKIDGILDEAGWKDAPAALGYTEFRPTPFRPESEQNRTEVYMLYSDEGIYLGGYCHEKTKDSISTELNGRDGFGNNDFIGFVFDTYNDKINGFEYFITPLGEQMDAKMSNGGNEDFGWNAVWKSGAKILNDGWTFEIFIPFSAIRFSKKNIQDWGLNITRRRQKISQQVAWNPVDPNVSGFLTQEGFWTGLENIKPPLRLQFSPYFSVYANNSPTVSGKKLWTSQVNGGMDVKYGISQALTLDMMVIPDFGQVKSDNQVLNLTPFETRFQENRAFFTEGTELFNKGNYFYSRRIGGTPINSWKAYQNLAPGETVVENPNQSKIINATKVSGRLQSGLGIGFFNAITRPEYAIIEDGAKNRRKVQVGPLTNYNITVLNQSLKHNSSVTLLNTNVWRSGSDYDANVTAGLFDFNNKKNMWNFGGKVATSQLLNYNPDGSTVTGYSHSLYFGKVSGRFNFNVGQDLINDKFNYDDLGIMYFNNSLDHYSWFGYRWTKPGKWYNNLNLNVNAYYSRQLTPSIYRNANFNANINGQMKNLWYVGALIGYEPEFNDFFESRTGKIFRGWSNLFYDLWFETNFSKKYGVYAEALYVDRSLFNSQRYLLSFQQRYRFSDKFSVTHFIQAEPQKRNAGFADHYFTDPVTNMLTPSYSFGKRNRETVENRLSFKYSFNDKMYINTFVRHYWSAAKYEQLYDLLDNGELTPNNHNPAEANKNFNFFNVDATYTWEFAPGSFIYLVWKNAALHANDRAYDNYFKNFKETMSADESNDFSFKIIYFLDYLTFKKKLSKKK
jgi:hypothetical protein